jgi:signal transduction histidine kinase
LISNAVRYTDAGYVEAKCTQSNEWIEIRVNDTGIGIAQEDLENIFQPYYQAYLDQEAHIRKDTGL